MVNTLIIAKDITPLNIEVANRKILAGSSSVKISAFNPAQTVIRAKYIFKMIGLLNLTNKSTNTIIENIKIEK